MIGALRHVWWKREPQGICRADTDITRGRERKRHTLASPFHSPSNLRPAQVRGNGPITHRWSKKRLLLIPSPQGSKHKDHHI